MHHPSQAQETPAFACGTQITQESVEIKQESVPDIGPVPPETITIPWALLAKTMFWSLGPAIRKAMKRKEQRLPVSALVPMPPEIHTAVFGQLELLLTTEEQVSRWLGPLVRKDFPYGAHATLGPPIRIQYIKSTGKTRVRFHYAVYNHENVLQWPEHYTIPDQMEGFDCSTDGEQEF